MQKVSTTFGEETVEDVEALVEDDGTDYASRAEAFRDLVAKGLRYDDDVADLEAELETLEARIDELTSQLQHQRERERDVEEVVEYVEEERSIQERRERERRRRESAGLATRAKWFLFGREFDDVDEERE